MVAGDFLRAAALPVIVMAAKFGAERLGFQRSGGQRRQALPQQNKNRQRHRDTTPRTRQKPAGKAHNKECRVGFHQIRFAGFIFQKPNT